MLGSSEGFKSVPPGARVNSVITAREICLGDLQVEHRLAIGLILGYTVSYLADRYQWITLDAQVYSLAYVPFDPRPVDALWIAAIAIAISFFASLYPARNATKIVPVEELRYE